MVTLAPTCFCTVRKFCRRVVSDTSAQVGRVAVRLRISAVVATFSNITGADKATRLRPGYSRITRISLICYKDEVHRNMRLHLDRFAIEDVRPIAPLTHCLDGRRHEHGVPRKQLQVFHRSVRVDGRRQNHWTLNACTPGERWVQGLHSSN